MDLSHVNSLRVQRLVLQMPLQRADVPGDRAGRRVHGLRGQQGRAALRAMPAQPLLLPHPGRQGPNPLRGLRL